MRATDETTEKLRDVRDELLKKYQEYKDRGLSLNISRGLPCKEQLDLNREMFHILDETNCYAEDGTDTRNYGVMYGLPECIHLFSELLHIPEKNIVLGGESSLNLMYDQFMRYYAFGTLGSEPWCRQGHLKWLCPVPGYDCHFNLTEALGFEMINIPMSKEGPDMDLIEKLVAEDPSIKGIWCVPQYTNPQGYCYSDETVERLAKMKTAAKDFRIFWDNAYAVHHLYKENIVKDIFEAAKPYGNENRILYFFSTAKITFPGSGVCLMATGDEGIAEVKELLKLQIFSHDKLNQLRHVKFFKDLDGLHAHMRKHAALLRPKFELVLDTLEKELGGLGIGQWTSPHGGYFISFDSLDGCAKAIVAKAKEAGVVLNGAGATYPYGKDPKDSNIRIAPSFPTLEDLGKAAQVFVLCVKLASVEKLLAM